MVNQDLFNTVLEGYESVPGQMQLGDRIGHRGGIHTEKMGAAPAVGASETVHLRDPAEGLHPLRQFALRDRVGIGDPRLGGVSDGGQIVDVPLQFLVMCQMSLETLVETGHRTAHVAVRAR